MLKQKQVTIQTVNDIIVLFSGDSGDGMQLSGSILSTVSAVLGNDIATFPDFPAEIRAPQGTLNGVSGYQIRLGSNVFSPGEQIDVLVAMNPAALKVNVHRLKKDAIIIIDSDSFGKKDLEKARFETDNPFEELGLGSDRHIVDVKVTTHTQESLADFEMDSKDKARCKNMFALGLVCWLFQKPLDPAYRFIKTKFAKKEVIAQANIKVLTDGFNYGQNTELKIAPYRIEIADNKPGYYTDITGNQATAYGLIAAAERSGKELFLGSYPITPATDIMHEMVKRKELGIKALQMEDEIAGICSALGASFAGCLAATTTSGPGLALKSEAIGLAVMSELPVVVIDVQRSGPSTGMPTKTEQTDLRQALYGRNGECPVVVIAAYGPTSCFDCAYWAAKIALEHVTPVILLTDGYIANGSSAWRIPNLEEYPAIIPHNVSHYAGCDWNFALRDETTKARYFAEAGQEKYMHRIGGLERDYHNGSISTGNANHQKMVNTRQEKIDYIANVIPPLEVWGDTDADLLVLGWGGTFGHIREAVERVRSQGKKVALTHFRFINPLPKNTKEILQKYPKLLVAEQNSGHLAGHLADKVGDIHIHKFNRIEGQPFSIDDLVEEINSQLEK